MKTRAENTQFLQEEVRGIYAQLTPQHQPKWGRMDAQQMLEHLNLAMQLSNGKRNLEITTPSERVEKLKNISLLSDRPLPVNFQNPVLPAEPVPYHFDSFEKAYHELWTETDSFFSYFTQQDATHTRVHNMFGNLNYDEWLLFHYKHFMHHAMQFGLVADFTRL